MYRYHYADSGYSGPSNVISEPPSSCWQLTSLSLHAIEFTKDVILWLLSPAVDLTRLQSLVIAAVNLLEVVPNVIELPTPSLFEQLVVTIGSSVRKLTLGMEWDDNTNQFTTEEIKHFTALEELIVISDQGTHLKHGIFQILCLLPALDGTSVTEIILNIKDRDIGETIEDIVLQEHFDNLDKALDRATLPHFRRFVLFVVTNVVGPYFVVTLGNILRAQMPRLLSRGLLEITVERTTGMGVVDLKLYHIPD